MIAILDRINNLDHVVSEIPLDDSTRVQVVDSFSTLSRVRRAQYAAFVLSERCLVVWAESATEIIPRIVNLEKMMIDLVWGSNPLSKESVFVTTEALPDLEECDNMERPKQHLGTIVTCIAVMILFLFVGLACRELLLQTLADRSWIRWSLLAVVPFNLILASFFSMVISGSVVQSLGPIKQITSNSTTYSAIAPPRMRGSLPHITIQCPVYKESLVTVIEPTMVSVRAAISTYELQGGTASVFVNDDGMQLLSESEVRIRKAYYASNSIGWVARPPHGQDGFIRAGKFKKASNMNFALRFAYEVEEGLSNQERGDHWTEEDESAVYSTVFQKVQQQNPRAWAEGDVRLGDLILLIDSDTRVPRDCLLDAASEFEESPQLAILQHSSGVMMVVNNFWEEAIAHFTKIVYNAIRYGCAAGELAPFVGHNAFLRWSALQEVVEDKEGVKSWWSESHVSEDFELSLKLQIKGYATRLATYTEGEFKEGVSLTVYDEIARWQKYAYGCSELVFHPCKSWFKSGPFTPLFKKFLLSNLPGIRKFPILAYIFSYYAIGSAWLLSIVNYFITGWFDGSLDHSYVSSWAITVSVLLIFGGVTPFVQAVMTHRMKKGHFLQEILRNYGWTLLLTVFLGGLSLHVSMALLCHMLSIDMSWSSTAKELETSNFWLEVPKIAKRFKYMYIALTLLTIGMIVAATPLMPRGWAIDSFYSVVPLALLVGNHFITPLVMNPQLMTFSF